MNLKLVNCVFKIGLIKGIELSSIPGNALQHGAFNMNQASLRYNGAF